MSQPYIYKRIIPSEIFSTPQQSNIMFPLIYTRILGPLRPRHPSGPLIGPRMCPDMWKRISRFYGCFFLSNLTQFCQDVGPCRLACDLGSHCPQIGPACILYPWFHSYLNISDMDVPDKGLVSRLGFRYCPTMAAALKELQSQCERTMPSLEEPSAPPLQFMSDQVTQAVKSF